MTINQMDRGQPPWCFSCPRTFPVDGDREQMAYYSSLNYSADWAPVHKTFTIIRNPLLHIVQDGKFFQAKK